MFQPTKVTKVGLLLLLSKAIEAAAGTMDVLINSKVKLFVNDVDPGEGAVAADFTLATFTGGEPITITAWSEVFTANTGYPTVVGPLMQFQWTGGDTETVFGVVLTNAGGTVIAYARLDEEKTMDGSDDLIALVAKFSMTPAGFGSFDLVAA